MRVTLLLVIWLLSVSAEAKPTLEMLFKKPDVTGVKISPNGKHLAIRRKLPDDRYALQFVALDGFKPTGRIDINTAGQKLEVGNFWWANNERVIGTVLDYEGKRFPVNKMELFGVDPTGENAKLLFSYRIQINPTWGQYIHRYPPDPSKVLIRTQQMSTANERIPEVQTLDVNTGVTGPVLATGMTPMTQFFADDEGEVRLMLSSAELEELRVRIRPGEEWMDIPADRIGTRFQPVSLTDDADALYSVDQFGTDKRALYRFDIEKMQQEVIYEHPVVDVHQVVTSTDLREVLAMQVFDGVSSYLMLDSEHEERDVFRELLALFPGQMVTITSRSDDGRYWIVGTFSARDAGTYHLFDREKKTIGSLFRQHANVDPAALGEMIPISYRSGDLTIHGYFTQAPGVEPGKGPLLVLVHGGPRMRDVWTYNPEVQGFAVNGISVLQINYRGSTGYGDAFMNAGNGEWGGKVQEDILNGVRWAIGEGHADPERICIGGTSFGAYSAVMSASIEPGKFQCVIANGGIYDLSLLYTKGDIQERFFGEGYLEEVIGNDKNQLKAFSPVSRAGEIKARVLVAHGKKDRRAPYAHAKRLVRALKRAKVPYETMFESREGHGFYDTENQVMFMQRSIDFIHANTAK